MEVLGGIRGPRSKSGIVQLCCTIEEELRGAARSRLELQYRGPLRRAPECHSPIAGVDRYH